MIALLGLIPSKDWIYGGIIAALLAVFGWYTVHERDVEHAKDVAAAAKAVAVDNQIVKADNVRAAITETQNALIYEKAVAIPAIADIGLVCQRSARSVPLPPASAGEAPGTGNDAVIIGVGSTYDPSGPVLTRARDADAEIAYLQSRVHELEKQMNEAP